METIAIVGQGCVFPNCFSPQQLWDTVASGAVHLSPARGKWRVDEQKILARPGKYTADTAFTSMGGYVRGFSSVFSPQRYQLDPQFLLALDPLFQWSLYAGEQACSDVSAKRRKNAGVILGNLCYPTAMFTELYEQEILSQLPDYKPQRAVNPYNRFHGGFPAQVVAAGLGLSGGETFTLNAACASGIYAIKLACDILMRGEADLMLAGAVNAADFMILNMGFSALKALSPTGQSRPFHREADGLIPAEGAGIVALQRVEDAVADGCRILGIIRAIGLSNDGQQGGFLVPSQQGQIRCIEHAFAQCNVDPQDVSLVECHATGTTTGDANELESMAQVFSPHQGLVIGGSKANFGHLLAASGVTGLMKVLGAFAHRAKPQTPNAFPVIQQVENSGFCVLQKTEPWDKNGTPRIAGINSFGFGGNNAHLIVEEWTGKPRRVAAKKSIDTVVAVAVEVCTHITDTTEEFLQWMIAPEAVEISQLPGISLPAKLKFPPKDLEQALGQQLLLLKAVYRAVQRISTSARTGVFIGSNVDADACRYALRWRLADLLQVPSEQWLQQARENITPSFEAANVIGTMANILANRVNNQFDYHGPGFTIFAEELSGDRALKIAIEAIAAGEIDCAVVGAVDLCREQLHQRVWRQLGNRDLPADTAVAIILKTATQAQKANEKRLVAFVEQNSDIDIAIADKDLSLPRLGHCHAASGLLTKAFAMLLADRGYTILDGKITPLLPAKKLPNIAITTNSFTQTTCTTTIKPVRDASEGESPISVPALYTYAAESREALLHSISENQQGQSGKYRLAFVAYEKDFAATQQSALEYLHTGKNSQPRHIFYRDSPIEGELAFVFTGAAAAYPEMGRELLWGFPELIRDTAKQVKNIEQYAGWLYDNSEQKRLPFTELSGCSFLCQIHAQFTRNILEIAPDAVIGLSSGETNAMFAFGIWQDMDGLLQDVQQSELYSRHLAGDFASVRQYWKLRATANVHWENWRIQAPVEDVAKAVAGKRAYISIVYTDHDCVIGGQAEVCHRIIEERNYQAFPIDHNLAIHCPVVTPFVESWRDIHTRPCHTVPAARFYSNYFGGAYEINTQNVRDALTGQALQTVDFPAIIRQAWRDGVRIFVEHGPKNSLGQAIAEILQGKPHFAISLDISGKSSLLQALAVAAELWCAGVEVNTERLQKRAESASSQEKSLQYRWRMPPIELPPLPPLAKASNYSKNLLIRDWHTENSQVFREFLHYQQQAMLSYQQFLINTQRQLMKNKTGQAWSSQVLEHEQQTSALPGPKFSRDQLETLSREKISSIFGEEFVFQDQYPVQVRMPEPPLLLCDRVLGIMGRPLSMGTGTIWTETDIREDSWYLYRGRMPAGILIESGQADLLLISWLGIDQYNRGQRVYRLLGCELVFHDSLPQPGDTLQYQIEATGHANSGDVRMFFFRYDCTINGKPLISVRNGQAGFFTSQELRDSLGVLWTAETAEYTASPQLAPTLVVPQKSFSEPQIIAYSTGDIVSCFGDDYSWSQTHTQTPTIAAGKMNFISQVLEFTTDGGPEQRGYLRASKKIAPDEWFFTGHFHNDPCMPGTLMAQACLQTMAFYLTGLGYTLDKDGWRFEPVTEQKYKFICRGQVTPKSQELIYELFVDEIIAEPHPTLYAHVLCTVDGVKAFLCERLGLRLIPDWPLTTMRHLLKDEKHQVASYQNFAFDHNSIMHSAIGQPSKAFGPRFQHYDQRRSPRLPGPPYLFISRIADISGEMQQMEVGSSVEAVYDIPQDAWYFKEAATMPHSALLEVALQPCGWLACFMLSRENSQRELLFRNLDGVATQFREITSNDRRIVTKSTLLNYAQLGETIILKFDVQCFAVDAKVYQTQTVFGFFSPSAFEDQKGLPSQPHEQRFFQKSSEFTIDFSTRPAPYFNSSLSLPKGMSLMIDDITGYWPQAGKSGQDVLRAQKRVKVDDWFFKAHFFQDPVQPGSLGVEAVLQVLQFYLIHKYGRQQGVFAPVVLNSQIEWHYRGQIIPSNQEITILVEILEHHSTLAMATASVWVDDCKIYDIPRIGMEIRLEQPSVTEKQWHIHLRDHPYLRDHCPTFTLPALPITLELDMMAQAAGDFYRDKNIVAAEVDVYSWVIFNQDFRQGRYLCSRKDNLLRVELQISEHNGYETVASATFGFAENFAAPAIPSLSELDEERLRESPYTKGELFHGRAFQLMTNWLIGNNGARCEVEASSKGVPVGLLHPGLLDASLHCIPFDNLHLWHQEISPLLAGYPIGIRDFQVFAALPTTGIVTVEARFVALEMATFPIIQIWIFYHRQLLVTFKIKVALQQKGKLGNRDPQLRREFLVNHRFIPGVSLSEVCASSTLSLREIKRCNWLPGTVNCIYDCPEQGQKLAEHIVAVEHAAQYLHIHPRYVRLDDAGCCLNLPLNHLSVRTESNSDCVVAHSDAVSEIQWRKIRDYWIAVSAKHGFIHDMVASLLHNFVRRVVLSDPANFSELSQRPVLYLANHQTAVESLLFLAITSALTKTTAKAIAKDSHRHSWLGMLADIANSTMGKSPLGMLFFKREQQRDIFNALRQFEAETSEMTSLLVHVAGTRSCNCRDKTTRISSIFHDLALRLRWPVVPVKFVGGLPVTGDTRHDFPCKYGQQDYYIGRAIFPQELERYSYKERSQVILDAIHSLGPMQELEMPLARDATFFTEKIPPEYTPLQSTLMQSLLSIPDVSEQTKKISEHLLKGVQLTDGMGLEISKLLKANL